MKTGFKKYPRHSITLIIYLYHNLKTTKQRNTDSPQLIVILFYLHYYILIIILVEHFPVDIKARIKTQDKVSLATYKYVTMHPKEHYKGCKISCS